MYFLQEKLLQFVCVAAGGLVGELKKGDSDTRQLLAQMVEEIVELDPEFILKVSHCLLIFEVLS